MQLIQKSSVSLIASLCREVSSIRNKESQMRLALNSCINNKLKLRIEKEILLLSHRKNEVLKSAITIRESNLGDNLSLEFLIELCTR